MELNQLAAVLNKIDQAIGGDNLLASYERLIVALEHAAVAEADSAESAPIIQEHREALTLLHRSLEPVDWNADQHAIFQQYGARALMGEPVAERLNTIFIENFLQPVAVIEQLRDLHTATAQLQERVQAVLEGLAPVLTDLPPLAQPIINGEIVEDASLRMQPSPQHGVVDVIKERLGLQTVSQGALVSADSTPMRVKVMAAMPIALAAATKALDLYMAHNKKKTALAKPATQNHPIMPAQRTVINQYTRITTVRQSVVIVQRDNGGK